MEFVELWDLPDGALGEGWIDAHQQNPMWWDEVRLVNNLPVIPNPDRGLICQPDNSGARAAVYRDCGTDAGSNVSVSVVWSGLRPLEGTPLLHVNPDAAEFGLGAWYFSYASTLLIGTVGRSPDQFDVIQAIPCDHVHGMRRRIELRSMDTTFSVWISTRDVRSSFPDDGAYAEYAPGLIRSDLLPRSADIDERQTIADAVNPMVKVGMDYPIPGDLLGSTMHGVAIDLNNDASRAGNQAVVMAPFRVDQISA